MTQILDNNASPESCRLSRQSNRRSCTVFKTFSLTLVIFRVIQPLVCIPSRFGDELSAADFLPLSQTNSDPLKEKAVEPIKSVNYSKHSFYNVLKRPLGAKILPLSYSTILEILHLAITNFIKTPDNN